MAELMLRRTHRSQVVPVFERFIERFAKPEDLAIAREERIAKLLRPLGLRWRVPAFRAIAIDLIRQHNSHVPRDRLSLLRLAGVGDYVASAVQVFGFGVYAPLIDTNTVRIAGRYFGFSYGPESRRNAAAREQVARLFDPHHPRESAAAILHFGAVICTARAPKCDVCPVRHWCVFAPRRRGSSASSLSH